MNLFVLIKYTSGQSHARQSQSFYDRSPHCNQQCHVLDMYSGCDDDYGAEAGAGEDDDGDEAVHIDRAHMRLAACDALYEAQGTTTPVCKALTCCPARHCPAAPHPEHAALRRFACPPHSSDRPSWRGHGVGGDLAGRMCSVQSRTAILSCGIPTPVPHGARLVQTSQKMVLSWVCRGLVEGASGRSCHVHA